jgi:hypothetical protein
MKHQLKKLFATAGLVVAFVTISQAQPYYLTGDWQTPLTWQADSNVMTAGPNAGEWSYTITGGTPGAYGNAKVTDGTFANTWPGNNLYFLYDSTGSATIHFWPGSPGDGWLPFSNRVGYDDPDNSLGWGVAGAFDGWDGTQLPLTSLGNGIYSNVVTIATAGTNVDGFKFQSPAGSWANIYFGADFGNNNSDALYTTATSPQTEPIVLDLPNGRWVFGTPVPAVIPTNYITFQLDMSAQVLLGTFTNGFAGNSVAVAGGFIGWGTGAQLTNASILNPADPRTNLYIGTFGWQTALPASSGWKFRVNNLDGGYEQPASTAGGDRTLTITSANTTLPVLFYDDLKASDLVLQDTLVNFSVYVPNGAVGNGGVIFTKGSDTVWVSGAWLGWPTWGYLLLPSNQQLFESATPDVYTNSLVVPKGSSIAVTYKYSFDGADNENGANTNHIRYIRTYATNYSFPQDSWSWTVCPPGTPYPNPGIASTNIVEPSFGYLKIAAPASGSYPVTWLGRPGVILQGKSSLTSGSWNNYSGTDGTQSTNWPTGASGAVQFFRLEKY